VSTETLFKALAFISVVALVEVLERLRPGHPVDRRRELGLNLAALGIVMVSGPLFERFILDGLRDVHFSRFFEPFSRVHRLPSPVKIVAALLVADFFLYWLHRGMHETGVLWRTHEFHHSPDQLYWLSGARTSLTHAFLFSVPEIVLAYFLFALTPTEAGISFSIGVLINIWVHANLWVDIGPLQRVLITPNFHRVHHSAGPRMRKNLGFVVTVWDRIFGTYADPRAVGKDFPVGLAMKNRGLPRMVLGV